MEQGIRRFKKAFEREQRKQERRLDYLCRKRDELIRTKGSMIRVMSKEIAYLSKQIKIAEEKMETNMTLRNELSEDSSSESDTVVQRVQRVKGDGQ